MLESPSNDQSARTDDPESERPFLDGNGLESKIQTGDCLNCGAKIVEAFCSKCGQKRIDNRLSVRGLAKDLPNRFLNLERGLLATFVSMCIRPGEVPRDYVYGMRSKYVNPFAYFLIGATIQVFSVWFSGPILETEIRKNIDQVTANVGPETIEGMKKTYGEDIGGGFTELYFSTITQTYTYAALLFLAVPLAIALRLSHGLFDTRYRFAEFLVFSLYVVGHLLILTGLLSPIVTRISLSAQAFVGPGVYFVYCLLAHFGFLPGGIKRLLATLFSIGFATFVFICSILAIFVTSIIANTIMNALAEKAQSGG